MKIRRKNKEKEKTERERWRKGVYVLPNIFTTLNLFCGFIAIISALEGSFEKSAHLLIAAMAFDILDGKVARATRTTSRFGVEYDSLADVISFGMAPGLIMYLWMLRPMGKFGWLAAMIFLACGALRLARFNTNAATADSRWFTGLPIPAAAGMLATLILFAEKIELKINPEAPNFILIYFLLAGIYALSFLMVSSIKYASFKKLPAFLTREKNFNLLVIAVLLLVFIVQEPSVALFTLNLLYVVSGPFNSIYRRHAGQSDSQEVANTPGVKAGDSDHQSTSQI
jgi:CDP-diacylglycerol---serine O-phosphatidyltransferase